MYGHLKKYRQDNMHCIFLLLLRFSQNQHPQSDRQPWSPARPTPQHRSPAQPSLEASLPQSERKPQNKKNNKKKSYALQTTSRPHPKLQPHPKHCKNIKNATNKINLGVQIGNHGPAGQPRSPAKSAGQPRSPCLAQAGAPINEDFLFSFCFCLLFSR